VALHVLGMAAAAEAVQRLKGIQMDVGVEKCDRVLRRAGVGESESEAVVDEAPVERESALELVDARTVLPLKDERPAQLRMGLGKLRRELYRPLRELLRARQRRRLQIVAVHRLDIRPPFNLG